MAKLSSIDPYIQPCKVVFQPSGRSGVVAPGASLLEAAHQLGESIVSVCGGQGSCGKCLVRVEEGVFAKHGIRSTAAHLSPPDADEERLLIQQGAPTAARLACRAQVLGDVLITVLPESQAQPQVVYKTLEQQMRQIDPAIQLVRLSLGKPQACNSSQQERVLSAIREASEKAGAFDYAALQALPEVLREGGGALTATIWNRSRVIRVQQGHQTRALGLAVDIGSTTLAAYLCDLENGELLATAAATNPQVAYGDDIMSRISYAAEQPQGCERLHKVLIAAINGLAKQGTAEIGAVPADIVDAVFVGNSVMHHLLLNLNPDSLGHLPFLPVLRDPVDVRAVDLGLSLNPGAQAHVLPLVAGFVGADAVGVLLAEAPHVQDEVTLLIDVGTNGEIILGNRSRLLCTSAATGPALEGAQITHGMRAAAGAIERVRIDSTTLEPRFRVIGQAVWSDALAPADIHARGLCGSGIIEAVAEMFAAGIITASGRFDPTLHHPRLIRINGKQAFILAGSAQSATGKPIVITQSDLRAVQLAKAALYTGVRYLMQEYGVESVSHIVLAGAFGSLIDKKRAMMIGMIPDCDLGRVVSVGNAAGAGACAALLNREQRQEAIRLASWTEHVSISLKADFQERFADALAFPHACDLFPHIREGSCDAD
ncbi:MAG: DUF4445 domain-containing protein [Anaerolineae bacterium]|nr:DUF4445 domain-containing protein [Anaerolineae bacterium]